MYKKTLVTGASGFIGSHVADVLGERGYQVTAVDLRASSWPGRGRRLVLGDMEDADFLRRVTRNQEYVFHFAGIADLDACAENPELAVRVNVLGTVNLLAACVANKVKKFVFASSAYVFSDKGGIYRSTKRACENLIHDYARQYGLEYVILRFGSLYGPRSPQNNGLRRMAEGILNGGEYTHRGAADDVREYIYVRDAAEIAVDCLSEAYTNGHYLLTGLEKYTLADIATMIKEISGADTRLRYSQTGLEEHYKITPYHADVRPSPKLVKNPYYDLGQGILHLIEEIKAESSPGFIDMGMEK